MILAVAMLFAGIWFATRGDDESREAPALGPATRIEPSPTQESQPLDSSEVLPVESDFLPRVAASGQGTLPKFNGRGSIRGLVTAGKGDEVPETFTIHIGPSDSLFGRELAESSSQVCTSPEFVFDDLPLGGYDVWIEAEAMNSRRNPVLLTQTAPSPYVILRVAPTGFLDGYVMNLDGRPAQDLRVELAAVFTEDRLETTTRADGFYIFHDVPDGEYRILFGPQQAPLVPPRDLAFQAPSMRFPKIELPPTVDILIHTTNHVGEAVGDVTVTGFGKPEGRIEITTDFGGLGWARNLPPGRYRIAARNEEGLSAKITLEVANESRQEFWIAVR